MRAPDLHLPQFKRIPDFVLLAEHQGRLRISYKLPGFWRDVVFSDQRPAVSGLIDLFGSKDNFITARFADRIELVVLRNTTASEFVPDDFIEEDATDLKASDAEFLRVVLTCDACFDWNRNDHREPDYRFRVKFHRQQRVVIMDLCLLDRSVRVVGSGREFAPTNFEFGYYGVADVIERNFPGETPRDR